MTSPRRYATPDEAEAAFYGAFQRADGDAMMAVWAEDDDIVCVHPLGPRLQGRTAIESSWREIFAAGAELRFRVTRIQSTDTDALSVRCVLEYIEYGAPPQRSLVIATNVYRLTASGWRIVLHHASPGAPPAAQRPTRSSPPRTVH